MDRYKNAKIYKIIDNTNGAVYIGSTCLPTLAKRLAYHRGAYNKFLKGKSSYYTSFKILENNNYSIILLEEYPCETKDQLLARERFYIENTECVNKVIPSRTLKEYYEANADKIKEYQKEYREENADKIKEYHKEYKEANADKMKEKFTCECGGHYAYHNKSRHLKTRKHLKFINQNMLIVDKTT